MKRMLWAAAALLAVTSIPSAAVDTQTPAPDFTLQDIHGKKHTLSTLKGSYVVLEWTNPGCPFVKKHYDSGNMQSLQKEFTERGVVWLAVCSSAKGKQGHLPPPEWRREVKDKRIAATAVLLDETGTVGRLYGAKTTPHMFVVNPEGVLIYQGAIDDTPSTDPEDVKTAANYVRAALNEALAGKPVSQATTKPYGCGVKY